MSLTKKQRLFVEEYLQSWNATQAALKAGYSERSARAIGHENLTKPDIAEAIQQRINDVAMQADEVLLGLADIARGDLSQFFDVHGKVPVINFQKAQQAGMLPLLQEITFRADGSIKFKLYDKQAAMNTLAKHLGLLVERKEVTGKDGGPVEQRNINVNVNVESEHESADVLRYLADLGAIPSAASSNGHDPEAD